MLKQEQPVVYSPVHHAVPGAHRVLRFREISSRDELRELFSVRYLAYLQSGHFTIRHNIDELDVDPYDRYSRFLGAYILEEGQERMVGGIRMVQAKARSPLHDDIQAILGSARDSHLRSLPDRQTLFPCERGFDLTDLWQRVHRERLEVVEFSRTVCLPEFRGMNIGAGLVNGIFAMALASGVALGVGAAPPALRDFYISLGCKLLPRKPAYFESLGSDLYVMVIELRAPSAPFNTVCRELSSMLRQDGGYCQVSPQPRVLVGTSVSQPRL